MEYMNKFITCSDTNLNKILDFTIEIDKMTHIARQTLLLDKSRRENDAEHSWHISVMALLFKDYAIKPFNLEKSIKMLLVHDLVEIYAGDTFAFDKEGYKVKDTKEAAAAEKLYSILPEQQGKMLKSLWQEFEGMQSPEAKFASCMDRLQPFLHNTLTDGHTWVKGKVCKTQVEERLKVVKEFMPRVYEWVTININGAVNRGYIKNE